MQKNDNNNQITPDATLQAEKALRAVFSDSDAIQKFVDDCRERGGIDAFVAFAEKHGLIPRKDYSDFKEFINAGAKSQTSPVAEGIGFTDLLKEKNILRLETMGSLRNLTGAVNRFLDKWGMPNELRVSTTMLSRLRREQADSPKKRHTLRSLAFWIGYTRPDLAETWNYKALMAACTKRKAAPPVPKFGVRIGFHLQSLGDAIDTRMMKWLENEITACLDEINLLTSQKTSCQVKRHDTTTLHVDFPSLVPSPVAAGHPGAYRKCVRDAVAVSHQILLRWTLSKYITSKRKICIAIATGKYSDLDPLVRALLMVNIQGNPAIRVTDETRLAVIVNDIRAQFCGSPKLIDMFTGEVIKAWWITAFLSPIYWDFIPTMLEDKVLRAGSCRDALFREQLYFANFEWNQPDTIDYKNSPAIESFLKFPQNSLLAIEIAKILFYRRHFWDANEILRSLLSTDPCNIVARTFRMMIYWNAGSAEEDYGIAAQFYSKAEDEAELIQQRCPDMDEDFCCELALGRTAHALHIYRLIRNVNSDTGKGEIEPVHLADGRNLTEDDVFLLLEAADRALQKGIAISHTGHRSYYYVLLVRSLLNLLRSDRFFFVKGRQVLDEKGICIQTGMQFFSTTGWLRRDMDYDFYRNRLQAAVDLYDASVMLRSFMPTVKLAFAVLEWDFSPQLTVGSAKKVLQLLGEAEEMANKLDPKLCILSSARLAGFCGDVITPEQFVALVKNVVRKVKKVVGRDISAKPDTELLNKGLPVSLKLFTSPVCMEE